MNREEGIRQIDEAPWVRDGFGALHLYVTHPGDVHHPHESRVDAWLSMRPVYCDRGHIQLNIDGYLNLDSHDSFPRFFFSFAEADAHARTFLKWRIWKERVTDDAEMRDRFESPEMQARIKAIREMMEGPADTDGAA